MRNLDPRHIALVTKREYLEIVRTKVFLIMTILTPILIVAWSVLPSVMMGKRTHKNRTIVVATADPELAASLKERLEQGLVRNDESDKETAAPRRQTFTADVNYVVQTTSDLSDANRATLQKRIDTNDIDCFLWFDQEALANRKGQYFARETNDFIETNMLQSAVQQAFTRREFHRSGATDDDIARAMQRVSIKVTRWEKGRARSSNFALQFMLPFVLGMMMFMTVLLYGIGVMRAVLEEKSNRVMEVLMSTLTPSELMVGKILGVGAAGLTQVGIWVFMAALGIGGGMAMVGDALKDVDLPPFVGLYFAIFFLLGYFLYSTLCAAIGAMVNTEREAQQIQQFAMMPLIISFMIMMYAIRAPNDPMVAIASFVPFSAPLLMFMRTVVQTPPVWQIATSAAIMVVTIFLMFLVAGRIYRVGVLMYGKRPTLPEIIKWLRYS